MRARASWVAKARPDQLTPKGDWRLWLVCAGRGYGKTRTGAEDGAWFAVQNPGARVAIVGPTFADARDTMVEGESGLLSILPKDCVDTWNRSLGELILFNGARFKLFSADAPERLRGPQHHRALCDEVGAWDASSDAFDQLTFGLRLGKNPQVVVTTTPRSTALMRRLLKMPGAMITRGSTWANRANLPEGTLEHLRARYEGTRLGRQELEGELIEEVAGALWTAEMIDARRLPAAPEGLQRIVVAVDPSGTKGDGTGDDIGIVVAAKGTDGRFYVLQDASANLSPERWAQRVVDAYQRWQADRVVAEKNFGGDLVRAVLHNVSKNLPVTLVTASRGKVVRAEPISGLYEQGRVSHCGTFDQLEDELCAMTPAGFVGEGSPDRADALVWALTELSTGSTYNLAGALGMDGVLGRAVRAEPRSENQYLWQLYEQRGGHW